MHFLLSQRSPKSDENYFNIIILNDFKIDWFSIEKLHTNYDRHCCFLHELFIVIQ